MPKTQEIRISVPKPPRRRVIVDPELPKNMEGWIKHMSAMSERIVIRRLAASNADLSDLRAAFWELHQGHGIGEKRDRVYIDDWPKANELALLVSIDTSPLRDQKPKVNDTFIFCYNDFAFGLDYYRLGTDADICEGYLWAFVLPNRPKGVTTWRAVALEIKKRLLVVEKAVPPLPNE